jgi:hypothetical protein
MLLERFVALKVLHPTRSPTRTAAAFFMRPARPRAAC